MALSRMTVVIRGGGDLATGVAQKLWRAGFAVALLELAQPTAIRRSVALSSAMADGASQVEDMIARRLEDPAGCQAVWEKGEIPVLADPGCDTLPVLRPSIFVDATLAKRNLGTHRGMAPVTIALGPGFSAPEDVDAVIETMRGHYLGRLITKGEAQPNTGVPGELGGKTAERVVHAPVAGVVSHRHRIGDQVSRGEIIFLIGGTAVPSPLDGTLRGLIGAGLAVHQGMKCADVDPRPAGEVDCFTISDKARCLGGAVLEACFYLGRQKGLSF
ncbi:MAG: EF2563 family selenium-dependent molybdenum hydroxylase system protein [Peptococcaceae bacterium]|jgi:xanthine dehydrogenase accessory factor|nr:EF2563 family selenium-dependent molybdenum hydroxylase system protein [Peptococcaceae bacterium]